MPIDKEWLAPIANGFLWECRNAVRDPIAFSSFRLGDNMQCVVENKNPADSLTYWQYLEATAPHLCQSKEFLLQMDSIGLGEAAPLITPTTIANLADLAAVLQCFGGIDGMHVVEIGGGYGSLYALVRHFCKVASYTILDLDEPAALQDLFSKTLDIEPPSHTVTSQIDLLISDSGFSELNIDCRQNYAKTFKSVTKGWIEWNYPPLPYLAGVHDYLVGILDSKNVFRGSDIPGYEHPQKYRQFFWGSNFANPYSQEQRQARRKRLVKWKQAWSFIEP